jgi:YidC/Oxa1 family membrane protein insertase
MNIWDTFKQLFNFLVYDPQLNLLQLYFNLTKDIGLSIILVAVTVNLILWPVMVKSYISGQKLRILAPKLKEINAKYKTNPGDAPEKVMENIKSSRLESAELYKKHDIKTGVLFQVIFLQLFFASGVFYVVNNIVYSGQNNQSIKGIYSWLFGYSETRFPDTAFGFLNISTNSLAYIWLPITSFILSYLYGKYSFHWAPHAQIISNPPTNEITSKDKNSSTEELPISPESMQKFQEIMIIYIAPLMTAFLNAGWSTGLNLYFATLSLFNLIRQVIISQYYANHITKLINDIAESDPSLNQNIKSNEEIDYQDVAVIANKPIPTAKK